MTKYLVNFIKLPNEIILTIIYIDILKETQNSNENFNIFLYFGSLNYISKSTRMKTNLDLTNNKTNEQHVTAFSRNFTAYGATMSGRFSRIKKVIRKFYMFFLYWK